LLMDLHTGYDPQGLDADIFSAAPERFDPYLAGAVPLSPQLKLVHISASGGKDHTFAVGHTVIPSEVWRHPDFQYVGIEIYLPSDHGGSPFEAAYARDIITRLAAMAR